MQILKYGRNTFKSRTKEYQQEYMLRWCRENPSHYLWLSAKQRAKREDKEFLIEIADIVIPEFCPVLGTKLIQVRNPGGSTDASPTVDRRNNELGYVKGNVFVICNKANKLKSNMSKEDIGKMYEYVSTEP